MPEPVPFHDPFVPLEKFAHGSPRHHLRIIEQRTDIGLPPGRWGPSEEADQFLQKLNALLLTGRIVKPVVPFVLVIDEAAKITFKYKLPWKHR